MEQQHRMVTLVRVVLDRRQRHLVRGYPGRRQSQPLDWEHQESRHVGLVKRTGSRGKIIKYFDDNIAQHAAFQYKEDTRHRWMML